MLNVRLPLERFVPLPDASRLHGQAHVARVMVHAIRLAEADSESGDLLMW